jgi:hypothetical protein
MIIVASVSRLRLKAARASSVVSKLESAEMKGDGEVRRATSIPAAKEAATSASG